MNATSQALLQKYATAATAATFAVVGVSGVLLFFHLGQPYLMGVHEWLGLAFVAAAVFHVARHFRVFTNLLSKPRTKIIFALTALVTGAFVLTAALAPSGGNPMKQFINVAMNAPVSRLASVVDKSPDELLTQFSKAGLDDVSGDQTLAEIARRHGREAPALLRIVLSKDGQD